MKYEEAYNEFFDELGDGKKMVLSSSLNNIVTARMMSLVIINNEFYFQTDRKSRKYEQIKKNQNISLCIDNIQIEGVCEEMGKPIDCDNFINAYKKCFPGAYQLYTLLENERLFKITPKVIERWVYIESIPYMETIDIENEKYSLKKYLGNSKI